MPDISMRQKVHAPGTLRLHVGRVRLQCNKYSNKTSIHAGFVFVLLFSHIMKKRYWLMKCEPNEFSIDDLKKIDEYFWDGVRNYQVRNMFRDHMKVGDKALFYHSNTKEVGVVGEMEITKDVTPDQTQFDTESKYFDPFFSILITCIEPKLIKMKG